MTSPNTPLLDETKKARDNYYYKRHGAITSQPIRIAYMTFYIEACRRPAGLVVNVVVTERPSGSTKVFSSSLRRNENFRKDGKDPRGSRASC